MAEPRDDGGPAFPSHFYVAEPNTKPGMSLRDYFAAQVAGTFQTPLYSGGSSKNAATYELLAEAAYAMADALLAARKR